MHNRSYFDCDPMFTIQVPFCSGKIYYSDIRIGCISKHTILLQLVEYGFLVPETTCCNMKRHSNWLSFRYQPHDQKLCLGHVL